MGSSSRRHRTNKILKVLGILLLCLAIGYISTTLN